MSEPIDPTSAIENLMDPIPVPEMGIPVDGKQTKSFPGSANVFRIDYDFNTRELMVEFCNGGIYSYTGVPVEVWRAFTRADSAGKFIAAEIRGKYPSKKVEPASDTTATAEFPEL